MSKGSPEAKSTIEVDIPDTTIEAIEAYADRFDLTFDEATTKFIHIGLTAESLARGGAHIEVKLPQSRAASQDPKPPRVP